jgi:hypothetical protein
VDEALARVAAGMASSAQHLAALELTWQTWTISGLFATQAQQTGFPMKRTACSSLFVALLVGQLASEGFSQELPLAFDFNWPDLSWQAPRTPLESMASASAATDGQGTGSPTQDGAALDEGDPDEWDFLFAPYLWTASLTGSGEVQGNRISGTASFSDILDNLDLALQGYFEAGKGRWSFFVDGMFLELSDGVSTPLPGLSAEVRAQLWLFQWGAYYEVAKFALGGIFKDSSLAVEAMFGNRIYRLEARLRLSPGPNSEDDETWLDPIIGMRIPWKLPANFSLVTKGDIGGFGLGSHFSWQVQSMLKYEFQTRVPFFLAAGYRILGFNFSDGSGADKFKIDARLYGPIIGAGVAF